MSAAENLDHYPDDLVRLATFCSYTGITESTIYNKIHDKKLTEGKEFFRDPDGKIWISRNGYQSWVMSGCRSSATNCEPANKKTSPPKKTKPSRLRTVMAKPENKIRQLK